MHHTALYSIATKISGLACPRCTGTAFHKYGRHLGIQRYCCTSCGRTFNETVNTPLHGIHNKQKMRDYLATMNDQQSIRAASKTIGISVPTSFSWRHRILSSLSQQAQSDCFSPAGICEIKLPHSFKGKRGSHDKQMQETHSLLISDARGIPSLQLMVNKHKTFEAALQITNTMRSTAQIQILGSNLLSRASRKIPHNTLQNKSVGGFLLSQVIDTANKLTGWMARFNGVATKYLQQYWNWYRAEVNCPDFDYFRNECFGYRKLAYYRQVSGS